MSRPLLVRRFQHILKTANEGLARGRLTEGIHGQVMYGLPEQYSKTGS